MRTSKSGAALKALAVIITAFLTFSPIVASATESAATAMTAPVASASHSTSGRTQMVLAGMVTALAALMLLRRHSAKNS